MPSLVRLFSRTDSMSPVQTSITAGASKRSEILNACGWHNQFVLSTISLLRFWARNLGKALASTNAAHSFGLPIKRELLTTANLCSARFAGTDYRVACPFCAQFGPESRLSNVLRLVENFWLFIRLICSCGHHSY